ncbi:hypothetical protein [Bacillus thuringiensis]|uniref:Uncharacterized protein n=1 Tax=Bacillus thuringiensis Bt18247 TaxID=1423143 RepID=A0A9W3ST32_BACTU|nr:hypothetical protein [Bacillus thuringiensis]AOM11220.1 hypothetical protein BTI247_28310 [Bacillus thuringiensis Bt18247]MBG9527274.1 hypothetical protein [Bacillus thuringiensis]
MKNKEIACKQINEFLKSDDEKVMLIKGTNQKGKLPSVLEIIIQTKNLNNGLFRANRLESIANFFDRRVYDIPQNTGKMRVIENKTFYFDSFKNSTWKNTPDKLDFAVIYPLESLSSNKKDLQKENMEDIFVKRIIKKIFMVSLIDDGYDYEWLNQYVDRIIEFNK